MRKWLRQRLLAPLLLPKRLEMAATAVMTTITRREARMSNTIFLPQPNQMVETMVAAMTMVAAEEEPRPEEAGEGARLEAAHLAVEAAAQEP